MTEPEIPLVPINISQNVTAYLKGNIQVLSLPQRCSIKQMLFPVTGGAHQILSSVYKVECETAGTSGHRGPSGTH